MEWFTNFNTILVSWVMMYGPPVVALALFLGAIGIPIPTTFVVVAAGAFVRQELLELAIALPVAFVGVVLGDALSYGMGRFARGYVLRHFGQTSAWHTAKHNLQQRGGITIYLTRWLLTPIAVPTNLVAGSGGYSFNTFLRYDMAGELTWLMIYGGVGYAFSSQWEDISTLISDFSGFIIGAVVFGVGIFVLLRRRRSITANLIAPPEPPEPTNYHDALS